MNIHELLTIETDPRVLRVVADHVAQGAVVLRAHSAWRGRSESCDQHVAAGGGLSDALPHATRTSTGLRTHAEALERARSALDHALGAEADAAAVVADVTGSEPDGVDVDDVEPIRAAEQMERLAQRLRQRATQLEAM